VSQWCKKINPRGAGMKWQLLYPISEANEGFHEHAEEYRRARAEGWNRSEDVIEADSRLPFSPVLLKDDVP
jgi:hypothetical protein